MSRLWFFPQLFAGACLLLSAGCATTPDEPEETLKPKPVYTGTIVYPENEAGVQDFLKLLKNKHNQVAVGLTNAGVEFEAIPEEPEVKLKFANVHDREFFVYRTGFDQISPDGFFIIYVNRGVNHENGIWGFYELHQTKLVKHELLWPNGSLAAPFLTTKDNQRIFRFGKKENQNWMISEYQWDGHQFVMLNMR